MEEFPQIEGAHYSDLTDITSKCTLEAITTHISQQLGVSEVDKDMISDDIDTVFQSIFPLAHRNLIEITNNIDSLRPEEALFAELEIMIQLSSTNPQLKDINEQLASIQESFKTRAIDVANTRLINLLPIRGWLKKGIRDGLDIRIKEEIQRLIPENKLFLPQIMRRRVNYDPQKMEEGNQLITDSLLNLLMGNFSKSHKSEDDNEPK